jgi:DtxR family Mn-dependent transcriptional regulator
MSRHVLSEIREGQSASILEIGDELQGPQRRRLLDLGVVPGARIQHKFDGPSGEPRAFEILGSVVALRKEQTDHIFINRKG